MNRTRSSMPVLAMLARIVVLGWVRRRGLSGRRALVLVLLVGVSLIVVSIGAAVWLARTQQHDELGFDVGVLPMALVIALFATSMLVSISAQGAGSALTPRVRSLVTLPVGTRLLAYGLGIPGIALTLALLAILSPVLVVMLAGQTGYGTAHAVAVVGATGLLGLLAGRILFTLVRRLVVRSGRLAPLGLTLAISGWLAVCVMSGWRAREILASGLDAASLTENAALLWPAVGAFTLEPSVASAALVLCLIMLVAAVDWALLGSSAALGLAAPPLMPVRIRFSSSRRAPLFWLEVARIVRHRRTVAWASSTVLILACLLAAGASVDAADRTSIVDNAVLIACQLLSYLALLARGMSRRERPYTVLLGIDPRRWAVTVMLASGAVAAAILTPFLLLLAIVADDLSVIPAGLALQVFVIVAASTIGFALVPGDENASAEFPGAGAVFALTVGVGLVVGQLLGTNELLPVALTMALGSLAFAWLPSAIEANRWRTVVGVTGPVLPSSGWHVGQKE